LDTQDIEKDKRSIFLSLELFEDFPRWSLWWWQ